MEIAPIWGLEIFLLLANTPVSGTGGADIGSFNASFTHSHVATLVSPASGTNAAVNRANGFTLTWSGGTSDSYIQIDGQSATDPSNTNGASFTCFVSGQRGHIHHSAERAAGAPGGLTVGGWDFKPSMLPAAFSASGLNLSFIQMNYDTPIFTTLQ